MSFGSVSTMRQLEERQVEFQVRLLMWSPKMDILALALQSGEIILYRLNWQKIWSKRPPSEDCFCSSLVWRPDGKILCAGYTSGHIVILDVESGQSVFTNTMEGEISSLSWIQCPDSEMEEKQPATDLEEGRGRNGSALSEKDNIWDFLTKFPLLSKAYSSNMEVVEDTAECQKLHDGSHNSSLLVAGTNKGRISVFMNGYLLCCAIDLNMLVNSGCSIQQVSIASNLSTFSVLCTDSSARSDSDDPQDSTTVKLVILSMHLLASCYLELRELSVMFSILQGTLGYLGETLKQISEAWEGIVVELDAKLESFSSKLPDGAMAADFLELLMFGTPSAELEHFLLQDLTEKGLKKLIGSIDASYLNIQRLLLKYLHVVAQSLNYFLFEMSGMAMATDKLEILGLTLPKIKEAQRCAGQFWCKGIELQQVIDDSRKSCRIFFHWLHGEILKLSDEPVPDALCKTTQQQTNFIAEFLANFDVNDGAEDEESADMASASCSKRFSHKHLEKVGQYLKNEELEQPSMNRKDNPWHAFVESNPELKDTELILQVNETSSLFQEHESMKAAISDIFATMRTEMTDKCQFLGELQVQFPGCPSSYNLCCRQFESDTKVLGLVAMGSRVLDHGHSDDVQSATQQLFYYELVTGSKSVPPFISSSHVTPATSTSRHMLKALWIGFGDPPGGSLPSLRLIDTHFYTSDMLSLFLGHSPVSDNQRIVQLPIEHVKPYLRDVPMSSFQPTCLCASMRDTFNALSIYSLADQACHRDLENIAACQFAVSGPRKVVAFLFRNRKRIRIYDMEVEVDEEEEETLGTSEFSSELNNSN